MIFLETLEQNKSFFSDCDIYDKRFEILSRLTTFFNEELKFEILIGVELEFYITDSKGYPLENELDEVFLKNFLEKIKKENSLSLNNIILDLTSERGFNQFELTTKPCNDLISLSKDISNTKKTIKKLAQEQGFFATFLAQPFLDDCGSSLQFNISLHEKNTFKNLFSRNIVQDTKEKTYSELMLKSISGLCDIMEETLAIFAPNTSDYHRYLIDKNLHLHREGKFLSPTKICWGGNNRTTAIRIPTTKFTLDEYEPDRRIEYRVASANTSPEMAIVAILVGIKHGLLNNIKLPQKISGIAFEGEISNDLTNLSNSLEQALEVFDKKEILKNLNKK